MFLFRQGRLEEALRPLEATVKEQPGAARAHGELGRVLLQLGRLEAATARLARAVELDPKYRAARLLLGRAYLRLGRTAEGERELELAAAGYGSEIVR